jgi:hypothetical protein
LKRTLEENGCKTLQNEHVTIKVDGKNLLINTAQNTAMSQKPFFDYKKATI